MRIDEGFIQENNARILAGFQFQPRYRQEFTQPEKKDREKLTADERRMLVTIDAYQYKSTLTQIREVVGFSAGKSSRMFSALDKAGMIKILKITKGKGISKYPVLLEPAYRLLNLEEKKFYGKGAGDEHVLWQHLVARHLSDYKPQIERFKGEKSIDVVIETNEFFLAIEVAMTSVHEKENLLKDFNNAKADFVVVACRDEKVENEVKGMLIEMPEGMRNKTRVCLLSEVLKKQPDDFINGIILRNI